MDFKKYKQKEGERGNLSRESAKFSEKEKKAAEEAINQYSGKSENELLDEFVKRYSSEVKAGRMDKAKLQTMVKNIEGMLDEGQRKKLRSIIDSL